MQLTRIILLAIFWLPSGAFLCAADLGARMQGVWFGAGRHPMSRTVLIVDGDNFTIVSPLGVFVSKYTIDDSLPLAAIDIDRFDGERQLGVIELSDGELRLKLNKSNKPRPTLEDVRFPSGKPHWHTVFQRRATRDGLESLAKHDEKLSAAVE